MTNARNAEAQGRVHVECPYESEHSKEGGTATMVVNAIDSQLGYWTWFCKHDACQGRHKLGFLEEALRQGWFSEELLSEESPYMMPGGDDLLEDVAPRDRTEAMANLADDAADDLTALVQEIVDKMHSYNVAGKATGNVARLYSGNTSEEDVRGGMFGLLDILNAMDEPLKLEKWDYKERFEDDETRVTYSNSRRVGGKFKLAAMKTYRVTIGGIEVDVGFHREYDPHKKVNCYTIVYPGGEIAVSKAVGDRG